MKHLFLVTLRTCRLEIKLKHKVRHSHFSMILTTNCSNHFFFCEDLPAFLKSFLCCHSTFCTEKCFPKKKKNIKVNSYFVQCICLDQSITSNQNITCILKCFSRLGFKE